MSIRQRCFDSTGAQGGTVHHVSTSTRQRCFDSMGPQCGAVCHVLCTTI